MRVAQTEAHNTAAGATFEIWLSSDAEIIVNSSQSRLINVGAQDDKRRQQSQALGAAILDNELFVELCNQAMVGISARCHGKPAGV